MFQSDHFLSFNRHLETLSGFLRGTAWKEDKIGRWSLPKNGPVVIEAPCDKSADTMVRSIVDALPLEGLTLVPRSGVVRSEARGWSRRAWNTQLPALFLLDDEFHQS